MKSAAEDQAYGVANITSDLRLQFQVRLSDAGIEAMAKCLAEMEWVTN
jgi:hypothetical protein